MSRLISRTLYSEIEINGRVLMLKIDFDYSGRFEASVKLPRESGYVDFQDEGIPYPCKARWTNKTMDRVLELCFFEVVRHFGTQTPGVTV